MASSGKSIHVNARALQHDRDPPDDLDEAKEAFTDVPLVKAGLIEIDAIPLGPFLNWEMLFAHAAEARATLGVMRRETNA
jgi:hypothetical protein